MSVVKSSHIMDLLCSFCFVKISSLDSFDSAQVETPEFRVVLLVAQRPIKLETSNVCILTPLKIGT